MTDARWPRIERLFDHARFLPPGDRAAFLERECAGDAELRRRVEKLLAANDRLTEETAAGAGFLDALDPVRASALLEDTATGATTDSVPDPTVIGRYSVVRRLGCGAMGLVYLARDPALNRPVALKLLPPERGGDIHASRRLTNEARAASALDHPNIGTIYEIGRTEDERPYIAMAYYDGETVRERIARGPLPVDEAVALALQVADGLAAAHAGGIVHRDIKPENLVVTPEGRLRILDFGIARIAEDALTRTGETVGTVAYMSPEQTQGASVDGRSDLWALGVVLYEMLTGTRPFRGDAHAAVIYGIRNDSPAPVLSLRPDVPPDLAAVVERCLEKDPDARYASAVELAAALRGVVPTAGGVTTPAGAAVPAASATAAPSTSSARSAPSPLLRTGLLAVVYVAAAWTGQRVVSAESELAVLPAWAPVATLVALMLGAGLVLATAYAQAARPPRRDPTGGTPLAGLTWRRALAAGAVALALLVAGAGGHVALRALGVGPFGTLLSRGVIEDRDPIVLADFSADAADPRIGRAVTEALRIDLHQSPTLRLAESGEVVGALWRMERDVADGLPEDVAREMALREGWKAVIAGEIDRLGGGYVLAARVVAAEDGTTLVALRETARDSTGLIDAVDRLSKRLRERLGESLRALHAAEPLPRVATASLPALRRYAEAYAMAWAGGDDARIAELLEETVALDSTFAAAYRGLATTYWNLRADRRRALEALSRAYALRDRLSERERYLVEATYHWQAEGDPALTREAYRRVLAVAPEDATSRANLGLALLFAGEPVEAERVLREGLGPAAPAIMPINLAQALFFQGRSEEALAILDSISTGPDGTRTPNPFAENMRARILGGDERWAEAESVALDVLGRFGHGPHVRAEAVRALWHLALARGRLDEAERHFTELDSLFSRIGALDALARAWIQRADARLTLLGDTAGARAVLDSLLNRRDLDLLTVGATLAPRAAAVLAGVGDTVRAAELVARWKAQPPLMRTDPDGYSAEHARARIELTAGRPDAAAERLRRASAGTIQAINYLPDLGRAYEAAGRPDSAVAVLERYLDFRHIRRLHRLPGHLGPVLLRLADLYEAEADTTRAIAAYARLVALWRDADTELKPHVEHARRRLDTLSDLEGNGSGPVP